MAIMLRLNEGTKTQLRADIFKAVQDVFLNDIKNDAIANSPVTAEGMQLNLQKRPNGKLTDIGGTGTNSRSIDSETVETEKGPQATLFTQSGYGGYLETGTSKMRAQPYLWPAFRKFQKKITDTVRELNKSR